MRLDYTITRPKPVPVEAPYDGPVLDLPRVDGTSLYGLVDKLAVEAVTLFVYGWAFDPRLADESMEILVLHEDRVLGQGLANHRRPDVLTAGAPTDKVGFKVPLKPTGKEHELRIVARASRGEQILQLIRVHTPLPAQRLTRDDVIHGFALFFGRVPENEDAIANQLAHHKTKESFFCAMTRSPEFQRNHASSISLLHAMGR